MSWMSALRRWLSRRPQNGHSEPVPLLAYYWSGGPVRPHELQNVSEYGAFIQTQDLWGFGTRLQIRLQECEQTNGEEERRNLSYLLEAVVTRCVPEGLEVQFVFPDRKHQRHFKQFLDTIQQPDLAVSRGRSQSGSSLVEFALLIPLLFLLIVNAVNFGGFFYAWITVANAARTGAQYRIMGGAMVSSPTPPSSGQVYSAISQDVASLPNISSLAVRVCTNTAGTIACNSTGTGTFSNPPADTRPEANLYVMSWVDVQYTYRPFIPAFHFPGMGIHGTIPPTTVRRQAVMRVLQ